MDASNNGDVARDLGVFTLLNTSDACRFLIQMIIRMTVCLRLRLMGCFLSTEFCVVVLTSVFFGWIPRYASCFFFVVWVLIGVCLAVEHVEWNMLSSRCNLFISFVTLSDVELLRRKALRDTPEHTLAKSRSTELTVSVDMLTLSR